MRVRKKPGALEALMALEPWYIHEPLECKGKWHDIFGNNHPIHAEFGGGKGKFITEMAKQYPETNFIMVDVITEVMLKAAEKAFDLKLPNLRLIKIDLKFADQYFEKGELSRIYLNFSDPWPKKRHYKRRLTYRGFLENYQKLLIEEGEIHFKTDNRNLFEFSLNEFAAIDMKMKNISLDLHSSDFEGNCMTEYEEKFSSQGMPIYRVEAKFR